MSGDFVLQAGVCLPRGDEVGQGVWPEGTCLLDGLWEGART